MKAENKKSVLKLRKRQKRKKPVFKRQESKMKKLKKGWRKPKGKHSKMRMYEKARGPHPSTGYSSPRSVRGMTRSGLKPIHVSNPSQLAKLDAKNEIAIIAASVGKAKRIQIIEQAKKLGVKVMNA